MSNNIKFLFTGKILLYLLPILSLIIIPLAFVENNLSILGSYIAIPIFLAPIVYMKYKKYISRSISYIDENYREGLFLFLLVLYLLCLSISIILLRIYDIRPFSYYIVVTIMSVIIMLEILLFEISHKKSIIILVQTMILSANIVWSVTLKYHYFIERTDILAHTWYITNLLNQGHVTYIFDLYQKFPLWHILVASYYMITEISIPIHKIMFLINGINFAFMILIVYLISLKVFKDKKIALVSALFMAINPDIIFYGMTSIPRTVVAFFDVILISLLLDNKSSRKMFLAMILTLIIIMYHTISMPFIIFILLVIYMVQKIYNVEDDYKFVTRNYILFAIVTTLTYWIFFANNIFQILVKNIISPGAEGVLTKSITYAPLNELFNYLQFSPLLFFVIISAIWIFESDRFSGLEKIFGMTGLLLVGVSFPGPVLLSNKLASNFNLERFNLYSLTLILIVSAVGFMLVYRSMGKKLKVIAIILFVMMSFLSVSNDFNASDNPLVKRVFYTFYLDKGETIAFDHVANITDGYVMSDYVTKRYLLFSQYKSKAHLLEVDTKNMSFLRKDNNDVMLIRNKELDKRPLKFLNPKTGKFELDPNEEGFLDYYYQDSPLWSSLNRYHLIYDAGDISAFS